MMIFSRLWILCLPLLLAGCGVTTGINLGQYHDPDYRRDHFAVCHGFNCYYRTEAGVTDAQWKKVKALFTPAPKSAEKERAVIAKAMGLMERYAGQSSGVNKDEAKAHSFEQDRLNQMDCIDETVNTSLYLKFMDEDGFFTFHRYHPPVHRGYFIDGAWPHNAGAIIDQESGEIYAVDTYYRDHGQEAYVIPLKQWAAFWRPEDTQKEEQE